MGFVVASLTSPNTSEVSVKKLTVVLLSCAKYSNSVATWIEQELTNHVRELGKKVIQQLHQLFSEVVAHNKKNPETLQKCQRFDSESGSSTMLTSTSTAGISKAMESMEKSKRTKDGGKTIKYELQLPSMQNLTSRSSTQAFMLRV